MRYQTHAMAIASGIRALERAAAACVLTALAACGGGGGDGDSGTRLSVSPSSVSFSAVEGEIPDPAIVSVSFVGDGVLVGYAPGVPEPAWLTIMEQSSTETTAVISLLAGPLEAGSYSTSVRFVTGRADGSDVKTFDLPVGYEVVQPFDVISSEPSLEFASIRKSAEGPQPASGYTLTIVGSRAEWRVESTAPWLEVSPASGTGPGTVVVTADDASADLGSFDATITVIDDDSGESRSFPASLVNRVAHLTVAPASFQFVVDTFTPASALSQTVEISDELGGDEASEAVAWTLASVSASWVEWSPASGSSSPAVLGSVSLVPAELEKLAPGEHSATVALEFDNADAAGQTLMIPVELDYRPAHVTFVAPYIGIAGEAGSLIVRGVNFGAGGGTLTLAIGATEIGPLLPDGDTQIRVSYPAMPEGRYPVSVKNEAGLLLTDAELVVIDPPVLSYQAIEAPSTRNRLVYDAERETLYAVNRADQQIERYVLSEGTWSADTPYILPELTDLGLWPNGRSLVALTKEAVNEIPLDEGPFAAEQRAANPDQFCGRHLARAGVANNGKVVIVVHLSGCSGYSEVYAYDLLDDSIETIIGSLYFGRIEAPANGSRLFSGSNGVSPDPSVSTFDALTNTMTEHHDVRYTLRALSVSGDASRVIFQNTDVYSGSLSLTGKLPISETAGVALASRDSTRAYVYTDSENDPRIEVYDLEGALDVDGFYPLLKAVDLADSPNAASGTYADITLAETPDGAALFVSGDSRILVVPVD